MRKSEIIGHSFASFHTICSFISPTVSSVLWSEKGQQKVRSNLNEIIKLNMQEC